MSVFVDTVTGKQAALEAAMNEEYYKARHAEGRSNSDESSTSMETGSDSEHEAAPPRKRRATRKLVCKRNLHGNIPLPLENKILKELALTHLCAAATGHTAGQSARDHSSCVNLISWCNTWYIRFHSYLLAAIICYFARHLIWFVKWFQEWRIVIISGVLFLFVQIISCKISGLCFVSLSGVPLEMSGCLFLWIDTNLHRFGFVVQDPLLPVLLTCIPNLRYFSSKISVWTSCWFVQVSNVSANPTFLLLYAGVHTGQGTWSSLTTSGQKKRCWSWDWGLPVPAAPGRKWCWRYGMLTSFLIFNKIHNVELISIQFIMETKVDHIDKRVSVCMLIFWNGKCYFHMLLCCNHRRRNGMGQGVMATPRFQPTLLLKSPFLFQI